MTETKARAANFIEQMNMKLAEYQLQKALKMQQAQSKSGQHYCCQTFAKQTLIELDDEADISKNTQEDINIGRWSSYKVPDKPQERLSLSKKMKKGNFRDSFKYLLERQRGYLQTHSQSQHTIPKLKIILNQLQCPLNNPSAHRSNQARIVSSAAKMKNYIGAQALVISNKLQIKSAVKSARKSLNTLGDIPQILQKGENKRPESGGSHFKGQPASSGYKKIKRKIGGSTQQCELVYQKQILSQLIKGNMNRGSNNEGPLSNLLNFFTMSGGDTKRKINAKLGLDKLLC